MKEKMNELNKMKGNKILSTLVISFLTLSLLTVSIPLASAAAPTLTLSPTSGRGVLGDGSNTFGGWSSATEITVAGTGFPTEQDDIQLRIALTTEEITTTAGDLIPLRYYSIIGTGANYINADGNGNFKATFRVPSLEAGTYNIFAVYQPTGGSLTSTSGAVFTVNADMLVLEENLQSATGVYNSKVHILLTGFGESETINIIPGNFLVTAADGTTAFTGFDVGTDGSTSALTTNVGYVAYNRPGGTFSVIVFGSSSGLTISKSFTVKPTIAIDLDSDVTMEPSVSVPVSASTVYLWGRNWPATTPLKEIAANSLKIKTSTTTYMTTHSLITVPATGKFGPVAVTYFDNLPAVPLSVELDATTFSLSAANIIPPDSLRAALQQDGSVSASGLFPLAGGLVASDPSRPDYVELTSTTIQHSGRARKAVYLYAISGLASTIYTGPIPWAVTWDGTLTAVQGMTSTDANGAALAFFYTIPNTLHTEGAFDSHTIAFEGALVGAGSQTLQVLPYVSSLSSSSNPRGYRETFTVSGYGFDPAESVSVTVGGLTWFTVPIASISAYGSFAVTCDPLPKLASGSQTVVFKGADVDNTYSRSITIKTVVIRDPAITPSEPLTTNTAAVGDPVVLRSSVKIGVFGLKASQLYDITVGDVKVASFTSTSDGTIPGAISFTAPSLRAGIYCVDIIDKTTGASALFALTRYLGDVYQAYYPPAYGTAGAGLRLTIQIKLTVSPSAATVGSSISVSGGGLASATMYYVTLSDSDDELSGPYAGFDLASFTTTAGGAIPSGVNFIVPDLTNDIETGDTWYVHVSTSTQLGSLESTGSGSLIVYASASITPTSGEAGSRVDIALKGLTANRLYNIQFGYAVVSGTVEPGVVVGSVVADALGKVTTFFTVPSYARGNYNIQLYDTGSANYNVLNMMPVFTISPPPTPAVGTGTFTPSEPKLLNSAGSPVTSIAKNTAFYTQVKLVNNVGTSLSVYVISQIKNSAGIVVATGITAADVGAGVTKDVPVVFLGIATSGTYTVTTFVWSSITDPTALAPITSFSITIA